MGAVLAEAHIGHDDEAIVALAKGAERARDRPERIERALATAVFLRGKPEDEQPADPRGSGSSRDLTDPGDRPAHVSG